MPGIGSIFAEQMKRCKDRLFVDDADRYERVLAARERESKYIQDMLLANRILHGEVDRLKRELQILAREYEQLRDSIKAEIFSAPMEEKGDE